MHILCISYILNVYIYILVVMCIYYRRKFRSQISNNMDRWKSRGGKSQRREEQKKEDRERVRRKKMQAREKVAKSQNTVFIRWFVAPEGRKVSSLKQSHVARWEAVVARSTFPSQNAQKTPCLDRFWKWRCRKSARRCGVQHMSKSKCTKNTLFGPLLEVEMSKKCTPLWREAHFEVKSAKNWGVRSTFGHSDVKSEWVGGERKGKQAKSEISLEPKCFGGTYNK